jgi:hypothetical protein
MKTEKYEIISEGIDDTSHATRGKNVFYKCMLCKTIIPSLPDDNIGCDCGNVFIDIDYFRLAVKDYSKIQILRKE